MTEPALLPVLLRLATGLVVVVALICACAWLARRAGLLQRPGARLLRQVDHLALAPRTSVSVVAVHDTWLVLGVTTNQVSVLHHLPAPATDAATHLTTVPALPAGTPTGTFAALLQTLRRRAPHATPASATGL